MTLKPDRAWPGAGDSVRGESDIGIAEEKKPEYRCEGEEVRPELGVGYVCPEVLPVRAESSLGRAKLGESKLGRDGDGIGSV